MDGPIPTSIPLKQPSNAKIIDHFPLFGEVLAWQAGDGGDVLEEVGPGELRMRVVD